MSSISQIVAAAGPGLIFVIVLSELACLAKGWPTPGQVIQWWASDHPIVASLFAGFVGAFSAHIFWHT